MKVHIAIYDEDGKWIDSLDGEGNDIEETTKNALENHEHLLREQREVVRIGGEK